VNVLFPISPIERDDGDPPFVRLTIVDVVAIVVEAAHVDRIAIGMGSRIVERMNAASTTEGVFRLVGVERVCS